jgi:hypothetical protein
MGMSFPGLDEFLLAERDVVTHPQMNTPLPWGAPMPALG